MTPAPRGRYRQHTRSRFLALRSPAWIAGVASRALPAQTPPCYIRCCFYSTRSAASRALPYTCRSVCAFALRSACAQRSWRGSQAATHSAYRASRSRQAGRGAAFCASAVVGGERTRRWRFPGSMLRTTTTRCAAQTPQQLSRVTTQLPRTARTPAAAATEHLRALCEFVSDASGGLVRNALQA
jgi:hypothetical protein